MLDDKLEKELKLRKNPKTLDHLNGFKEASIFINNIKEGLENDYKDKLYINTESNIFSVKNENDKKRVKTYNINNYEKIFYQNREKSFLTFKEEKNAEIIKNIFDLIKIRQKRIQNIANKTILTGIDKNSFTKYQINITYTNPDTIRIISNKLNKNKKENFQNRLSYEKDFIKNRTLVLNENPIFQNNNILASDERRKFNNISTLKNDILNLDRTAKRFNKNFISRIKFMNTNFIENKKKFDISLIKPKKLKKISLNYYEDENNKNFIKNKNYFNHYIKKLNTYKYHNDIINKFFENKNNDIEDSIKKIPNEKKKIEINNDEYYYLREKPKHKSIPALTKFNKIKTMFKSQIDKEIFNMFNKKI